MGIASHFVLALDSIAEHGRDEHSESSHAAENVGLNQTNKEYSLVPSQTLTSSPRDNADVSLDQLNERVCKLMFDLSSVEAKQLVQKVSAQIDSSLEGNAYAKVPKVTLYMVQGQIGGGGGVGWGGGVSDVPPPPQGFDPLLTQRVRLLYYFEISTFGDVP